MTPIIVDQNEILKCYRKPSFDTHKGVQGHALLIGGSYGKIGSMVLSTKASLKSGCGLVTAFVPKCGYDILQISFPEAMVLTGKNKKNISEIEFEIEPNAIGIGMGIGQERLTQKGFHKFLKSNKIPLLIDADGINILSNNKDWISLLPPKTILTPHFKELQRLLGTWNSEEEKLKKTKEFSIKNNLIIVVKDVPTFIIDGENSFQNSTGNQALATAGSGDVLSGIITGLLAQSYEPIHAAKLGVYLHGLTADLALPETGYESFTASTIIEYLGKAFLTLKK